MSGEKQNNRDAFERTTERVVKQLRKWGHTGNAEEVARKRVRKVARRTDRKQEE